MNIFFFIIVVMYLRNFSKLLKYIDFRVSYWFGKVLKLIIDLVKLKDWMKSFLYDFVFLMFNVFLIYLMILFVGVVRIIFMVIIVYFVSL